MNYNKKAIGFDLDGTLWDMTTLTVKSANEVLKNHNYSEEITTETVMKNMGNNFEDCANSYLSFIPEKEKRFELMKEICDKISNFALNYGGKIYSGVNKTLKELSKDYSIFLISNSANIEYLEAFVNHSNTKEYFSGLIPCSMLKITKSEAIKNLKEKFDLDPVCYIGDTTKDKIAADEANVKFIHAYYGFEKNVSSNYQLYKFEDIKYMI